MSRRRLLFISYLVPPVNAIAATRTGAMIEAFASHGWEVTLVAPHPKMYRTTTGAVAEAIAHYRARGVSLLYTRHPLRFLSPAFVRYPGERWLRMPAAVARRLWYACVPRDPAFGWECAALRTITRLRPGSFELVVGSASPWCIPAIAAAAGHHLGCPYVIDYRDLWSGNPRKQFQPGWILRRNRRTDRRCADGAAGLTVVAPSMAEWFREHGIRTPVAVIPNGFPADIDAPPAPAPPPLLVALVGTVIMPDASPAPALAAIARLARAGDPIRFVYAGPDAPTVRTLVAEAGLTDRSVIHGFLPRSAAQELLAQAHVSLVLTSNGQWARSHGERGIITGKVFELIAMRRQIIAVCPEDADLRGFLATTGGGSCFTGQDIDGIANHLRGLLQGRKVPYTAPHTFSWDAIGTRLHAFAAERIPS